MRHAATETHAKVSLRELHLEEFLQHDEILLHRQFTDIYRYTDRIHIYTDTRLFTDIYRYTARTYRYTDRTPLVHTFPRQSARRHWCATTLICTVHTPAKVGCLFFLLGPN